MGEPLAGEVGGEGEGGCFLLEGLEGGMGGEEVEGWEWGVLGLVAHVARVREFGPVTQGFQSTVDRRKALRMLDYTVRALRGLAEEDLVSQIGISCDN